MWSRHIHLPILIGSETMKKYVLSAAYSTPPLFIYDEMPKGEATLLGSLGVSARPYSGSVNVDTLGLPIELSEAIKSWDSEYQQTFCASDPKSSGFDDTELERQYHEEGERLCRLVAEQLGTEVTVEYRR
jgi:hypothetical protein